MICATLLALAFASGLAAAAEPSLIRAHDLRLAGDDSHVRLVIDLDSEPNPQWQFLKNPHRLVIDLPGAALSFDSQHAKPRGLVSAMRYGRVDGGASRLILSTRGPFVVQGLDVLKNEDGKGYRVVADLSAAPEAAFDRAMADQMATTAATAAPKGDRVVPTGPAPKKPFTIVLDPGHGGIDGGAEGITGTQEKAVTLAFARELKAKLEGHGGYVVHMTRDDDTFLRLDERVRIARQQGADIFISIHADTIKYKGLRGATVYTVSDQASDADSAALAARENLSDELAGMSVQDADHQVSDILMDLIRRETHSFSIHFARTLLGEMTDKVDMIKNPHRFAGFRVLKAPDVPSVLIELGYLSNPEDEAHLNSAEWRGRAVSSIASAIGLFAGARIGKGN